MGYSLLADAVVLVHGLFVLFVVLGGLVVLRWPRLAWLHVPAAIWGAMIELSGKVCPLTYLEVRFRRLAGETGYTESFIEHYIVPLIYPPGLTRGWQIAVGLLVAALNLAVYGVLHRRRR
ncbi:hypothetical protein GeomeDRAFT_2076 [Geobacter metallireducens RCH3]|uniref:DUF2784 domain-containing protein n=1 Tax=Geobacter metallireducens (strain ATCC 53774 / DSM 7210 / GS-15) TaxID=269799 RepID=Q39SH7_GEOMG|nr:MULTISPECIES: DUF2784 domain-containing protein [Geobacter]ABB32797.1 protein of unknown function DUF2784 [Geobacter metallireducens GS-15]EHP86093.1 hypothetical protein GeomeDRAFT_2076 [Geobacter metallireducens RCH3]MBT1075703.1 DUF2784 family protein [Geobacter grbiciae]